MSVLQWSAVLCCALYSWWSILSPCIQDQPPVQTVTQPTSQPQLANQPSHNLLVEPFSPPGLPVNPPGLPVTPTSWHSVSPPGSCSSVTSSLNMLSTPPSGSEIRIPDHWRPEVEQCITQQCLTGSARNEMVRALVNQLFAKSRKPTRYQCEDLARDLILKYPFVKDDLGNGYVSCKIM